MRSHVIISALCAAMPMYLFEAVAVPAVATINVGVTPTDVAFSPDGKRAYVVNNDNYNIANENNITVIDTETSLPITVINDASFNEPRGAWLLMLQEQKVTYVTVMHVR